MSDSSQIQTVRQQANVSNCYLNWNQLSPKCQTRSPSGLVFNHRFGTSPVLPRIRPTATTEAPHNCPSQLFYHWECWRKALILSPENDFDSKLYYVGRLYLQLMDHLEGFDRKEESLECARFLISMMPNPLYKENRPGSQSLNWA